MLHIVTLLLLFAMELCSYSSHITELNDKSVVITFKTVRLLKKYRLIIKIDKINNNNRIIYLNELNKNVLVA